MINSEHALVIALSGFCVFLLFIASVRHYARNSFLPAESWLLLSGAGYGFVQHHYLSGLPVVELSPDWVIWLLLPVLIFAGARHTSAGALLKQALPIACYAGLGVVLTLFLIGLPLSVILQIPVLDSLLFAAAVAATDPSAVAAIFQRFSIPVRLATLLEGESLFNDSTAIVVFGLIAGLVLADQTLDLTHAFLSLGWSVFSAIPLGVALGWLAGKLVSAWQEQNRFSGLSITLLLAYASYVLAEGLLHASGVIAVLCAALGFIATRQRGVALQEGEFFVAFWSYLETLAGSILFFALGAAVGAHEFPLSWAVPGVVLILLAARCVVVYGFGMLLNGLHKPLPLNWQHVLFLGGLRGAVSAALVLMIPEGYMYRTDMLCLVFVLCLYTLVVHPPLLRLYLQKIRLGD